MGEGKRRHEIAHAFGAVGKHCAWRWPLSGVPQAMLMHFWGLSGLSCHYTQTNQVAVELCQIWKSYWPPANWTQHRHLEAASATCRLAQAQQGTLRRWFWGNRNGIEQEASLTSCPSEIPGLLRDGCLALCKLMRGTICRTVLADVPPHTVPTAPNGEVYGGFQDHSAREDCAI